MIKTFEQFIASNRIENTVRTAAVKLADEVLKNIYWEFLKNATDINECDELDIAFVLSLANDDEYIREELEQNPYSIKEVYEKNKHIKLIDVVDSWVEENWEDVLDEHEVDAIYDFIEIGGVLGKEYLNGGKVETFGDLQRLVLSNVINQIKVNLQVVESISHSSSKPAFEYTPEEYQTVYDVVSEYYDGDDIEEFIYSTDIDDKYEFIEENEIENLRVCENCGKFMNEGFLYLDIETYCSEECLIESQGMYDKDDAYWTAWEG